MNFKVQFGKKIHKLPQGLRSFDELIFVIRTIFAQKLPDQYTFKYEDSDKEWIGLESKDDFEAAIGFFKESNINSMKVKIVRSLKPALDQYEVLDNDMTSSRIISFANKNVEEDLGESTIFKPQVKSEPPKEPSEQQPKSLLLKENEQKHFNEENNKPIGKEIDEAKLIEQILSDKNIDQIEKDNEVEVRQPSEVVEEKLMHFNDEIRFEQNDVQKQLAENERKVSEIHQVRDFSNANVDSITLSYSELNRMIEDIVEKKIRTLLSNYNLVPKQFKIEEQLQLNQLNQQINKLDSEVQEEKKEDYQNKAQIDSSQNISSSQIRDSFNASSTELKSKAILKTDPPAELNVESGNPYAWSFQFQNNGTSAWPKYTYFKCLQGPHKDQKIEVEQVKPQGVLDIKISLEAPIKANKYLEIWSLVQEIPDKPIVNFGPKVRYTLTVQEEEVNNNNVNSNNQKPSISISDPQNNTKINTQVLDVAKQMKEFLGGDIKKYIEFISMGNHLQLNLETLVNIYIDNQKI